jgi:hypothetical protein
LSIAGTKDDRRATPRRRQTAFGSTAICFAACRSPTRGLSSYSGGSQITSRHWPDQPRYAAR